MSDTSAKPRPEFRNIGVSQILKYRLPLAGRLSILHRVSGLLLFFCIPLVILPLFNLSVESQSTFAEVAQYAGNPLIKIVLLVLIWGYLHHFCAGIRFLALDLHVGIDKDSARKTAGWVFIVSLLLTVVFGLKLFGVF